MTKWAPVAGYPNYIVSDEGEVWSIERLVTDKNGRTMRFKARELGGWQRPYDGRRSVTLHTDDGEQRTVAVGALVLRGFVGEPEDGQQCRHLNGDATDDSISNLAWGTSSDNQNDAVFHGTNPLLRTGEEHSNSKLTWEIIREIREAWATGKYMQRTIGKVFGISQSHIHQIVTNKIWKE